MNLIFDTNYILHKNVQALYNMDRLYVDFHTMMENNIQKFISMNDWDNIFIVSDSKKKSWRQQILDKDYKGTRTKTQDIDWNFVYNEYNEFKNDLKEKNFNVFEKDHIEGDDWIAALVLKGNAKNQNNVIISSDQDLLQLIYYKLGNKPFINIQIEDKLNKERVFIPKGWELWLNEFENKRSSDPFVLDNSLSDITFFNKIINIYETVEVDRYEQLFKKFIMGDTGDNVPCPYKTLTNTGKERGIGKVGAQKIWKHYSNYYNEIFDTDDDNFASNIVECIESVNNIELIEGKKKTVKKNIESNIKLMELHYKHFPDWVLEEIVTEIKNKNIF